MINVGCATNNWSSSFFVLQFSTDIWRDSFVKTKKNMPIPDDRTKLKLTDPSKKKMQYLQCLFIRISVVHTVCINRYIKVLFLHSACISGYFLLDKLDIQ